MPVHRHLALVSVALCLATVLPGCAASDPTPVVAEENITSDVLRSKEEFFAQDMLFVRIVGWAGDPDALPSQRDDARLGDAEIRIYRTQAAHAEHCPSDGTLLYRSRAFSLRTSGNLTNGTPKSSYKISLDDKDDRLFGMKALNLKSMWNDVSQMREALAWQMFREAGVVAPRHTYARVCVDGQKNGQALTKYLGLYSVIEQIDKAMIRDHFGKKNEDGNLYKQYWADADVGPATLGYRKAGTDDSGAQYKKKTNIDERTYQLKTNDGERDPAERKTYDDLALLVRTIHGVGLPGEGDGKFESAAFAESLSQVFNVKQFLRWTALNALLGAWDNYWATPANYYLYNSGKKDAGSGFMAQPYFTWLPWDYDNTFGQDFTNAGWVTASISEFSGYDGRTSNMSNLPLLRNVLRNKAFMAYYLDAIEDLNTRVFTADQVTRAVAKLRPRVERSAFLEGEFANPAHTGRQFTNDEVQRHGFDHHELRRGSQFIWGIEHFVRVRHDNVAAQVEKLRRDRGLERGASGATFPASTEPLPR